jgi:sigma-B regulation protein RsbU (phosphoserine phosphatase)
MIVEPASAARILVADDQPDILAALRFLLTDGGYETELVTSVEAVLEALDRQAFDLLLVDLNYSRDTTSGREGLELISQIRSRDRSLPVVVMTGWGSIETAVEAMRRGARSFVQKPWDDTALLEVIARELREARASRVQDERQARELEEARLIQRGLLPSTFPVIDGCTIAGTWQPAFGFGGDCYDAIRFGDGVLGLSIADVVGKGLPAALLMSNLQAAVRAFASGSSLPRDLCGSVNRLLCRNVASGKFVTFYYCQVDVNRGTVTYANAGHNPPILVRADGRVERLTAGGTPLGVFADAPYEQAQVTLSSGDCLVLFTDGITEAENPAGEDFTDERLVASVVAHRGLHPGDLQQTILDAVRTFTGGVFQDDATLIVVGID